MAFKLYPCSTGSNLSVTKRCLLLFANCAASGGVGDDGAERLRLQKPFGRVVVGITESLKRYGSWSLRVKPWWIVFPNQMGLVPGAEPRRVSLDVGTRYWVRPNTRDLNEVLSVGLGWEYRGLATLAARQPTPRVIFDLGGHIGVFSVWVRQLFPQAQVVALEPNPDNYRLLTKNLTENGLETKTVAIPGAVTATNQEVELFLARHNNAHSLVRGGESVSDQSIRVAGHALKSLVAKYAPDGDYAFKMDIEGAEYDVLEASREVVARARFVVMEWHFRPEEKSARRAWLERTFTELGFTLTELSDRCLLAVR